MRTIGSGFKCFVVGVAICGLLIALPNAAQQSAAAKEGFEVISIKQVYSHRESAGGSTLTSGPNGFACRYQPDRVRCSLSIGGLIEEAYQVKQIELDGPKWLYSWDHYFQVEGTMPPGTSKETARLMLQAGLAERFGLKVHWEKRDTPVYALVTGKNGVKLQATADPEHPKLKPFTSPMGNTTGMAVVNGVGEFFAAAITMDDFAEQVWSRAGLERPVVNMTGLTGKYDIDLKWMPPEPPSFVDPGFVSVVETKLGLRLEKRVLPFNMLVVDHVEEMPTGN